MLESQVDMETGDYLKIGIRNNANTNAVVISDLQFRVSGVESSAKRNLTLLSTYR